MIIYNFEELMARTWTDMITTSSHFEEFGTEKNSRSNEATQCNYGNRLLDSKSIQCSFFIQSFSLPMICQMK